MPYISKPKEVLSRRDTLLVLGYGLTLGRFCGVAFGSESQVEPAPVYMAHIKRVVETLRLVGAPLNGADESAIRNTISSLASGDAVRAAEEVLSKYVLMRLSIDAQGLVTSAPGKAKCELVEQGWRSFLVRVENPNRLSCTLSLDPSTLSGAVIPEGDLAQRINLGTDSNYLIQTRLAEPVDVVNRWLGFKFHRQAPLQAALTGLKLEYQILHLYSRDRGRKTANLEAFSTAAPFVLIYGQQRGFEATFDCLPARDVLFEIKDSDGSGTTASVIVRDAMGRLYPAPAHRLEPDFDFQPQVYRADGETVRLPTGRYTVEAWRGPEYLKQVLRLSVANSVRAPRLEIRLRRWIDPAARGWFSGDTHLHASGCAHYEFPTMGVTPESMLRHVRGEGLYVGNILTWGPGFYYQKQFFTAHVHEPINELPLPQYQTANNSSLEPKPALHDPESMVRLDIEVSGFPSSHSGHLVLLNLKEQNFPGADRLEAWPTWNLPILQWAKAQGAVVGYAHCGLSVASTEIPNYEIPAFDLVGANEFLVDVALGAVDFLSGVSCHPAAELNLWYHALNCGFRTAMVGETDFPCLWDRAGNGRTYVRLTERPVGDVGFTLWVQGIQQRRLYFGDGRSHVIDFQINGQGMGEADVKLAQPDKIQVKTTVSARLDDEPIASIDEFNRPAYSFWHLERARIGNTRRVLLEVIVNGKVAATREITADGALRDIELELEIARSSWVAVRILPSVHTSPISIIVADQPVRASRSSAQWCLDSIDVIWREKSHRIRAPERLIAMAAYEEARRVYQEIISQCAWD